MPQSTPAMAREDLHDDDRVEALALEDLLGALEVDVRGIPGEGAVEGRRRCMTTRCIGPRV